jgi:preprotein translocase subunit SecA
VIRADRTRRRLLSHAARAVIQRGARVRGEGLVPTSFISNTTRDHRRGWKDYISELQGSTVRLDLRRYELPLAEIAGLEGAARALSNEELARRSLALRDRVRAGEPLEALRAQLFALAREAARRVLGQRPFDEQVVAALALDEGHVVEMQTGEGKTLAAVMPAALHAFADRGVHVLTFNDYLARRDAGWMGPVYRLLGLSVGCIQQGMSPGERRAGYHADITYVTAKEAGFDHLRDLLAMDRSDVVHRSFHFALVDEADSLLIDEATVPLVIAGQVESDASLAPRAAEVVASLVPGVHFDTDLYGRSTDLTDAGFEHVERRLGCGDLHGPANLALLTAVNCSLHARALLRRDVDYIVRNGRIDIVDEHTGRVVMDRHWPDGLQAALEAKEGLAGRADGRILGSLTLQRFLRGYSRLCGMTGTARDASAELQRTYGLEVVVIPPHRPSARIDREDWIFSDCEAKARAIVAEIKRAHASGRPVLIGTSTVTESERLADRLRSAGVSCQVLNAKNDAEEAEIVARAGAAGAVTISTNMAGRGTDIRLGAGSPEDGAHVASLGGLYVIGTNRHESRRVDRQLCGRAGRQGDPGESRFFVSLDDDLLVRFGDCRRTGPRDRLADRDTPIESLAVRSEVARAQRVAGGQQAEIRRTLERYAGIVGRQHEQLAEQRTAILLGECVPDVWERAPDRRARLVAAAGEPAVREAERAVTLASIDRAWRDHLAFCADLREGIHLVRLEGADPLARFIKEVMDQFSRIDEAIDETVLAALDRVRIADGTIDLAGTGLKAPTSTWTYVINDDPFQNRIGTLLNAVGGVTLGMYSAAMLTPLLILWGLVEQLWRRAPRRSAPRGK